MLVAPKTKLKRPLFDHEKFAADLSALHRKAYEPHTLPLTTLTFQEHGRTFRFMLDSIRYEYDLPSGALKSLGKPTREQLAQERAEAQGQGGGGGGGGGANQNFRNYSPDSTAFVFAREHNIYIVEVAKGDTVQLTSDGERWYSFGARDTAQSVQQRCQVQQNNQQQDDEQQDEGERQQQQTRSRDPRVRANVTWSKDSRAFYVSRSDSRKVSDLYLVNVLCDPRPALLSYKYAMPGEENVAQQELFFYRRGEAALTKASVAKWKDQRLFDIHWPSAGSDRVRLVRRDRLQRNLELIDVDVAANSVKVLLNESIELGYLERQNVRYLKTGGDFLWWSEKTGWGHLYLHAHDGTLKRTVTSGSWRVDGVIDVDTMKRVVYFRGVGREKDENPYFRHLYRASVDAGPLALLDPGNANHTSSLSPSKRYLVDNHSRIDMPGSAVVRDERGAVLMELEASDVSRLAEMGWKPPEEFMVKAADGVTDIYGVMWKPFDFDPAKKYPIIAHVYPGPQTETVTTTFSPNNTNQRLAQLGFIVIQIGNRGGSPARSNAYHSYGYFNLRDYGLADKKSGIEQLAARHSWIDIDRVGMYGHSGGGFMTAAALLQPPYNDFFKVGVSSAGNHDNNVYNQNWSEQHHGLKEVRTPKKATTEAQNGNGSDEEIVEEEVKFEIKVPANHELAENLKGRLLLVHGDMDNNVHPAGTIRLANALIRANKRFDFFIMPGQAHGFGPMQGYFTRMMYEYFAEHLMGDYYRAGADIR
jgi:dipeptidyl aminopeptidase/acylaminoacyl peptidase